MNVDDSDGWGAELCCLIGILQSQSVGRSHRGSNGFAHSVNGRPPQDQLAASALVLDSVYIWIGASPRPAASTCPM